VKLSKISAFVATCGLLAGTYSIAGSAPDPAVLSNPCAGCHGTDGASLGPAPVIGGLSKVYLEQTMNNYKRGQSYSTIMSRIAKGYDAAEIKAMASFFASKPWVSGKQEVDPKLVAKGQTLHMRKGCLGCHGLTGIPPSLTTPIPRLAGQYAEYLVLQMQDYQDPAVSISPAAMPMRLMLKDLSEEDLTALANFYASQK
jgi:sulfide dehydrogenase cytochrome subunit